MLQTTHVGGTQIVNKNKRIKRVAKANYIRVFHQFHVCILKNKRGNVVETLYSLLNPAA